MSGRFHRQFGPPSAAIAEHLSKPLRYGTHEPASEASPDTLAAAVLDFEARRDLTAPLETTLHNLDAEAIRLAAITGLRLTIAELLDRVTAAATPTMKAAYEAQLVAARRQLDAVRAWDAARAALLR